MLRRSAITLVPRATEPPPAEPPTLAGRARLEAMFRAHHETVWRTLRRWGLDAATAADFGQQAYLIAAERLADIRPGCERSFLIGTALRLARNNHRQANRLQLEEDMDLHLATSPASAERSDVELLDIVLARMDPTLIEVFVLFELEGFSSPEIAEILDVPVGTVASRLRRARDGFREAARRIELAMAREEGTT